MMNSHLCANADYFRRFVRNPRYKGVKGKERKAIVADILDRFNIVAKQDLFPEQLSGGQQQLAGIARAIVARPKL